MAGELCSASSPDTASRRDYPVSANQAKFLLTREIEEKGPNPAYMPLFQVGLRLFGPTRADTVQAALNTVVYRRSALRVRFEAIANIPVREREQTLGTFEATGVIVRPLFRQVLVESCVVGLKFCDFSGARNPEEKLLKACWVERIRPFDYAHPPLMRALLVKMAEQDHVVVITVDHIVSDGLSMRFLKEDFCEAFLDPNSGSRQGVDSAFLNLSRELDHAPSPLRAAALAYWREQWSRFGGHRFLSGDLHFARRLRDPSRSFGAHRVELGPGASQHLMRFTRGRKVSAHVLFLTAFAILLWYYTDRLKLGIWVNFANRKAPGADSAVGWFATMHLIGLELSASESGDKLLEYVKYVVANGVRHECVSLQQLWDSLRCHPRHRDLQVFMEFWARSPVAASRRRNANVTLQDLDLTDPCAPRLVPLGVHIEQDAALQFSITVRFAVALFPEAAMQQLAEDLSLIVRRLIAAPQSSVSELVPHGERPPSGHATPTGAMGEFALVGAEKIPGLPFSFETGKAPE